MAHHFQSGTDTEVEMTAMKDVVVLIPGIGGSALAKDGKEIWSITPGAALRGILSRGESINRLRLGGDDPNADDLGDGVRPTRLLPDFHLVPGLNWRIDGYGRFAQQVQARFDAVPGKNYFELPYDWRRDNRVAARQLATQSKQWLKEWRESSGNPDSKLVIVGHSMGGIVARLFLEFFDGWKDTRTLITLGTPYSGSINALDFLANGFRKGWGPFTVDLSETLRSFTSVYQLLPSYRCLRGEGNSWRNLDDDQVDWTGSGVDGQRLKAAIALQRELRSAVDARLAAGNPGYDVRPVIGDFQRTLWAATRDGTKVQTQHLRAKDEEGGDGTVPKISASPHELLEGFQQAAFVSQKHASLQNDNPVIDHIGGLLRRVPLDPVDVFPATDAAVSLEVEDVTTDEPMVVRAFNTAGLPLTASLTPIAGGGPIVVPLTAGADGWQTAARGDLAEGDYRVTVSGNGAHPVTEVVSVVDVSTIG
jgi:pimeloyl-ACP methyl ester carboxylesterase